MHLAAQLHLRCRNEWRDSLMGFQLTTKDYVEYIKKEDVRRKTDGFKAFEAAMFKADLLNEVDTTDFYDNLGWFMG